MTKWSTNCIVNGTKSKTDPTMQHNTDLIYSLEDKPVFWTSLTAAIQHVLASFIGIVTPTLIIGSVLGLHAHVPFLISMALFASGVGTYVQTKKIGPIGSGLVTVQGTSFAFISALLLAGSSVKNAGGTDEDIMAMLVGLCLAGAFVEVFLSVFIHKLKNIITPITTGIVITAIGLSLIKVGMTDLAGGFDAPKFSDPDQLLLGISVLLIIIFLNASSNPTLRLSAIFIGMLVGTLFAVIQGSISFSHLAQLPVMSVPTPFKYGIDFDWSLFLPIAVIYFFSAIETAGDLTANSLFCKLPVTGPAYIKRLKGGILGDGVNSMVAAIFNTFPNTTFGQNNGVIQLTGIASRKVGFFVAALLVFLGLFPMIGGVFQALPKPVLGGATLIMFAMVAVGGIKILTQHPLHRRDTLIIATSLGASVGVMMVPDALQQLPIWLKNLLSSPVTTAGLTAVLLSVSLPKTKTTDAPTNVVTDSN